MSPVGTFQDGGGDFLPVDEIDDHTKPKKVVENISKQKIDPYEGPSHQPTEKKEEVRGDEQTCLCSHSGSETKEHKLQQKITKKVTHRRREKLAQTEESTPMSSLQPILTDYFFDNELTESSPIIEDKSNEIRLQRQQQYRKELSQQIFQREEARAQGKVKKNLRVAQQHQESVSNTRGSRSAVESYENQLRMEQLDELRRQLDKQRDREVQRLRRIYRKDDRKFLAHLHRLRLQEDAGGRGDEVGNMSASTIPPVPSMADVHKKLESKPESVSPEALKTDVLEKAESPRVPPKKSEKEQIGDQLQARQPSSTTAAQIVEKPSQDPLTPKQAYLRLQQQRRVEETLLEDRRAKAAAWRADLARQERLRRDVRNMAEWRTGHSLAGVPLIPISSAQRSRFEAAASWLEKTRAAQQEKRIERDKQISSWRDEKDRQIKERRMKEKAEQKIAREMQNERRKEAEKSFQRWILEIRARKAAEKASIPRGAIGVSTYSSTYSLPSPWRPAPKQRWRERKCAPASLAGNRSGNVTHKGLS